jgi:hypothetical protein
MKIVVLEVINQNYIKVKCKYGYFVGKWVGDDIPRKGRYNMGINFTKILDYEILNEKEYYVGNINGKNIICGLVMTEGKIDEEKVDELFQWIDFGGDAVIHTDIDEDGETYEYIEGYNVIQGFIQINNLKNKYIKIVVDEIELFLYDE